MSKKTLADGREEFFPTMVEIINVADAVPTQERDLYRQGVASEILNRREKLLAKLRSSGVMVIDTEPDRISAALLDQYLEIKSRSLL